jgi:hypothetical protein
LGFDKEDEDATETDAGILGGLNDGGIVHDRGDDNLCPPNDDEEEYADNKFNDEDVIMDDEDGGGIIVAYGPVEYDDFNIPDTVEHFRMGGRHAVFGFYCQLVKPLKQGRKKLGIFCVICAKAVDGTNVD